MKQRTGKECKKTECGRYDSYKRWQCGDSNLNECMNCKWAFVSQFIRKPNERLHGQEGREVELCSLRPPPED